MIESIVKTAKLCNVRSFVNFIRSFLERAGFSNTAIFDVLLSSEEILVNITNYAYPPEAIGDIEAICFFDEKTSRVEITFIDKGISFNMLAVKKPVLNLPIENKHVGGIGIYLVKSLMEEIMYNRKDDKNILTIIKSK